MIEKKLKFATFYYDRYTKGFILKTDEGIITLNKVYAFAFMRFVIRIAQRNWFRKHEVSKEDKIKAKSEADKIDDIDYDSNKPEESVEGW